MKYFPHLKKFSSLQTLLVPLILSSINPGLVLPVPELQINGIRNFSCVFRFFLLNLMFLNSFMSCVSNMSFLLSTITYMNMQRT